MGGVASNSRNCGTQALDEVGAQDGAVAGVGEERVAHEREHAVRGWFQELDECPVRRGGLVVMPDADGDALVQRVGLAAMQKDAGQRDAILLHDGVVGATRIKLLLVRGRAEFSEAEEPVDSCRDDRERGAVDALGLIEVRVDFIEDADREREARARGANW